MCDKHPLVGLTMEEKEVGLKASYFTPPCTSKSSSSDFAVVGSLSLEWEEKTRSVLKGCSPLSANIP